MSHDSTQIDSKVVALEHDVFIEVAFHNTKVGSYFSLKDIPFSPAQVKIFSVSTEILRKVKRITPGCVRIAKPSQQP